MTDKRFTFYDNVFKYMETGILDNGSRINGENVCDLLNDLHEENQYLKSLKWNQDCINEISIGMQQRQLLEEENEQLQQRNDRQAKRLDNLYHLIEKEDWKTLTGIIQEFQECEEQLQREWGTYGDVE